MISPIFPRFRAPASVRLFLLLCGAFSVAHAAEPQTFPDFRVPIRSPGDEPITLPAAAENSGLPLTWTVAAGPVTVSGNVATLTGALGGVTLRATQAGNSEWEPLERFVTIPVTEDGGFKEMSGFHSHYQNLFAISRHGMMLHWVERKRPVKVRPDIRWTKVSATLHRLAVTESGALFSWGYGTDGVLGLGRVFDSYSSPQPVVGANDWRDVICLENRSTAIKQDGTLWGWGGYGLDSFTVPKLIDANPFWEQLSGDQFGYHIFRKSDGTVWQVGSKDVPVQPSFGMTGLKRAVLGQGGFLAIKNEGTLWFNYGDWRALSMDTDWTEISAGRNHYLALRADGTLWGGRISGGSTKIVPPVPLATAMRWKNIHAGFLKSAIISQDGGLWMFGPPSLSPAAGAVLETLSFYQGTASDSSLYRLAPDYFPQTLSFLENRERPVPVLTGSTIRAGAAECASGMPPAVTVLSGPATLVGDVITFTGDGPVEIAFTRPGDNTWSALDERVTFRAGPPGPEIAVHDGPLAAAPTRAADGPVTALGACTRAVAAAGILRSFTIKNTGQQPLLLTEITAEAASALTFSAEPASTVTIPPGGGFRLDLTLRTAEYGSHALTILLHSDDADEPVFRLPFTITVANTAPVASAGPDRAIPAGRAVRLDAAIFTTDSETPAADLAYSWDLESGGAYARTGAAQTITLPAPGQSLTAKLRVRDADGAESFSQCVLTATPADAPPATAIRVLAGQETQLVFPGEPGAKYEVQQSTSLQFWIRAAIANHPPDEPKVCGPDGFFSVRLRLPLSNSRGFYRAVRRE